MYKIINLYYRTFESYDSLWKLKNTLFVMLVISSIMFFLTLSILFFIKIKDETIKDCLTGMMIFFEALSIYLSIAIEKQRNERIKKKFRLLFKNKELTLFQIKRIWFRQALDLKPYEYINLIEKIEKYSSIQSRYEGKYINREKIYNFIFSSDSKNRVLAMFMGLVALFTGLLISTGINAEIIFELFKSIDVFKSILAIGFISLIIFGAFYIFKYSMYMILNFIEFISDNTVNKLKFSKRKKEIFIAQLLQLSELPKHRKKVYAQLNNSENIDKPTIN